VLYFEAKPKFLYGSSTLLAGVVLAHKVIHRMCAELLPAKNIITPPKNCASKNFLLESKALARSKLIVHKVIHTKCAKHVGRDAGKPNLQ